MTATPAPEPPTMRERYRAQVRGEVKQAALRQLAESGPAGLSVSAIGKQLGVSGPALYRYFASRDELLTELVIDAYDDLADALRAAASQPAGLEPRPRLEALARAYRSWALAQPQMHRLLGVLRELGDRTAPAPPQPLASQLTAWALAHDPGTRPATALRAVLAWSRLHGLVSLDIAGNFASMGIDPGQVFEAELGALTV